jgi:hypothetical protein
MEGGRREISDSYFYDKVYSGINIKQRAFTIIQSSPLSSQIIIPLQLS